MASRRATAIALSLIADLADRLAAVGISANNAPTLDEALACVWPLAKRLAKLEKSGKKAGKSARRARAAVLDAVVAGYAEMPGRWFEEFDPGRWHVALVPGPSREREREAA